MTDILNRIAAWLCKYAYMKIDNTYLSAFGRKVKRPQNGTIDNEIISSLSDLKVSDDAWKVFASEKNRRLICACIFAEDIGPAKHMDPTYTESMTDDVKERVRNEIREFILTVHERVWSSAVAERMSYREIQNSIRHDLAEVITELKALRDSQTQEDDEVVTSYPSPSSVFTGREMDLFELSLLLEKNRTVFVCGPEGIGKTEMCRKFADAWLSSGNEGEKRSVAWLGYDGDLRSTMVWHMKVNGIRENEILDEEKLFWSKLSILAEDNGVLLITDDVNEEDEYLRIISKYGFRKIFISENKEYLKRYAGIELKPLSDNDAYDMFIASLKEEKREFMKDKEKEVREMLRTAKGHALTISLAATAMNIHDKQPKEIADMISKDPAGRIGALLNISPLNDKEKEVLGTLSMLPISGMPLRRFKVFSGMEEDDLIIRSLENKGWANITKKERSGDEIISVHPSVMKITKERFGNKDNEYGLFFSSLERFFDLGRAFNNWTEKMDLLPVLISATDAASDSPYAPVLYSLAGRYLRGSGNYEAALEYYFKALELKERTFGADHPGIAPTYTGIGNVYSDKGEYDKAVEYYIKALKLSGRMAGINDPGIAATYNNVGISYAEKGEYEKALIYYEKALEIREKALGKDHEDTAATYNNLGNAYSDKGEYDQALIYYEKALEVREKVFGPDHYYTAVTHSNIGIVYLRKEEYEKASENLVKAMEIMRRTIGPEHPDTVAVHEMLSYICELTGKEDEYREYKPKPYTDWNSMYI